MVEEYHNISGKNDMDQQTDWDIFITSDRNCALTWTNK